ncbi:MAG TPA: glycoside hydrolase family 3 C-terminal domain-containing protein [Candidatus Limnocylindria bacterium]|nr:glycoside hydrolase family 3 C-terminal domain-containing protein [Candidatus Limnocylindria bacterium]
MDRTQATAKARALVSRMTAEEKASQLRYDAPAIPRLGIPQYNWWSEALHGVARAGTATVFPQAIGLAATFDPEFLREIAGVIAVEGRAKYNEAAALEDRNIYKGLTFWSPNINIFRDPRWGRGHETYGEDPFLTSRLGVAFVKGLQGDGEYLAAAACAKHFAVHSGPESLRHEFDAVASQKDLWETYLPAFEALVREAEVEAVMGAYNRVNGEPCCGSPTLLKDILRGQWGFGGHVVSDCWAIKDFHEAHHVTDTAPQSAALAIRNGCDLNCGNTYLHLLAALKEGLVTEDDLTQACERLMATRYRLGILDGASTPWDGLTLMDSDTPEHDALSYRAACRSMTLLKNDGILPLKADSIRTVAVIGPNADSQAALEGNYTGKSSRYTTFLEGIRQAFEGKARVLYALGSQLFNDSDSPITEKDTRHSEAIAAAKHADVVILCLGLDATLEGEQSDTSNAFVAGDKRDLELPPTQARLLSAVCATGKPVVTVLACGSALRVEEGNAILWAGYPGQAGGRALADILLGRVSPSGKLPVTFYRSVEDLPEFTDYAMENRTYRYFGGEPLYPFGYGLSYSRCRTSNAVYGNGSVAVDIENQGGMDAEEVVQVYVKNDHPDAPRNPVLCAFLRVALAPGERKSVRLPLSPLAFTVVGDDGVRREHTGARTLYVGTSQPDPRSRELTGQECLTLRIQ